MTDPAALGARAEDRLIVALDVPTLDAAVDLVQRLSPAVRRYKIGLELYVHEGQRAVSEIRALGGRVFLDLKFHDIPETVRRAARAASEMGAELITAHAAGGLEMLQAAVAGAREGGSAKVLAVTVLTSLDVKDLELVGTVAVYVEELVVKRARVAKLAGCHGVIASPREARAVRSAVGPDFLIITPGVRPTPGADGDDQKRTATARQAIADGADAVVVGRPIRDAPDPAAAARALLAEIA